MGSDPPHPSQADGSTFRPSLVLIDGPQTDEVAGSPTQVANRLEIMTGAILGLAGPGQNFAGLCTITVIKPHDLADQLLDRDAHPEWQGKRTRLVYQWPDREDLLAQYAELRRDGLRSGVAIDIQERLLFWSVASWGGGYSGHLLAYGTHPEQPGANFTAASAKRTLADVHPGGFTFHQAEHHMLLDHLTSEQPIAVSARGRTVDE